MATQPWLFSVTVAVSVVIGVLLIILVTVLMYYCWWKRRGAHLYQQDVASSKSSDERKVKGYHANTVYRGDLHDRVRNGFLTVPATRVHHDQRWATNHRREKPVLRYKAKRLQNGRAAQSNMGQFDRRCQTLDNRPRNAYVARNGILPAFSGRQHSAQTIVTGNTNYGYNRNHDLQSVDGATNVTTIINGKRHGHHTGTHSNGGISNGGRYITSVTNDDQGMIVTGPVLSSDSAVTRDVVMADDTTPRSYTSQSTKPIWISSSREQSTGRSDHSGTSGVPGPLIMTDQSGDIITRQLMTSESASDVLW